MNSWGVGALDRVRAARDRQLFQAGYEEAHIGPPLGMSSTGTEARNAAAVA